MSPGTVVRGPATPTVRMVRAAITAYQMVRAGRPSPCRYWPGCSDYALEALEIHGARSGLWLAARRLGRCRPLGGHGVDPVPARGGAPTGSRT